MIFQDPFPGALREVPTPRLTALVVSDFPPYLGSWSGVGAQCVSHRPPAKSCLHTGLNPMPPANLLSNAFISWLTSSPAPTVPPPCYDLIPVAGQSNLFNPPPKLNQ